mgnify:CR=1 FL=1
MIEIRAPAACEIASVVRVWHETKRDTYNFIPQEQGRTLDEDDAFFRREILPRSSVWIAVEGADVLGFIALIFAYLRIPTQYQYRVLFWGIVGAIVLRGLMIAAGTTLLHRFDWMFYVFGAILLLSALRMLRNGEDAHDVGNSFPARLVRRFIPVTPELERARFFVRREGKLFATPLFVALVMVELTDVVFAVDSIPAILAVTRDPFLVFTSNAFAILGLRSLYFAVAGLMAMFRYLRYSLVLILAFVGMKMLLVSTYHVSNLVSLAIILGTLGAGILASIWATRRDALNGSGDPPA